MKKKKIIIGCLIAILVIAFIAIGISKNGGSASVFSAAKTYTVKVAEIGKGEISSYVSSNGTTEEIEKAEVYFETPLKVKKLMVVQNQKVAKGQKLVEVDIDSLNLQLEKLRLSRETQVVAMGGKSAQTAVATAKSGLNSSQRAYEDAQKNYDSSVSLYNAGTIAKTELDRALNALKESQTALDTAKAAYDSAVSGKDVGDRTNSLNLKTMDLNISELEKQIQRINDACLSPIDGAVTEVNILEGSYTNSMQPSLRIVNTDKIRVKANVSEFDIKSVKPGQSVSITGDAIDKEKPVKGKVASISPVARLNTTTSGSEVVIEVLVDITDGIGQLRPGLTVNCDIYTVEKKDIVIAPMEAFKEDKDGNKTVLIVDPATKIMHEKPVKLGITSEMEAEVLEGLNEGDTVVMNPIPLYKDGSIARIQNDAK